MTAMAPNSPMSCHVGEITLVMMSAAKRELEPEEEPHAEAPPDGLPHSMGSAWPRHDDQELEQRFQRTEGDDEDGGGLDEAGLLLAPPG
jgi:hypothetical protein